MDICLFASLHSGRTGWTCIHTYGSVTQPLSQQLHYYKYCVSGPIPDHKGAFVLGGCCVFVCGSTGLLFVEAFLDYHCRERQLGMCPGSVGSGLARCQTPRWPESQSLFFLWLSCSAHSQTPSLSLFLSLLPPPLPSQMKTFPLVNRGKRVGLKTQQGLRRICHSVVLECL